MRLRPRLAFCLPPLLCLCLTARLEAGWRDSVGATRLEETFSGVPNSVGVVTQAEAGNSVGDNYLPDATNFVFAGKTIVNKSPGSGLSTHATVVGGLLCGTYESLLPATPTLHAYNASYWIETDFLRYNSSSAPLVETARVQNHSWIATGTGITEALVANIDQRLDFAIDRDGFIAVAGVNNGNSTTLPGLLCQAYNHITVGLSTGSHSAGFTTFDGAGRIKPDIVAPDFLTSYATPKVAGAAGVLAARAIASPHMLDGADVPRVVKALLLAGATKEEFPAWARTPARPLDLRYGAGELNILLAYRMLESGRAVGADDALVPGIGWAAETVAGGAEKTYFFEIPAEGVAAPLSVALTWHRLVEDGGIGPFWSASPLALVDLDLRLHHADGFVVGDLIDQSASSVDNVEHLYSSALAPGRYALVVSSPGGSATTDYALAWQTTPTVAITATAPEAREIDGSAGIFTISRSGSVATPLRVFFTVAGTAISGTHYTALPASALIPAGSASALVYVTPVVDALAQGDRSVVVNLTGDFSLAAGAFAAATVTVRDKPYDGWRFAHFTSGQLAQSDISGDAADPDVDGLVNLLEYALGADPQAADASGFTPLVAVEADETSSWLTLGYTQPTDRSDLAYVVEWSADPLTPWQAGAAVVTEVSRAPVAGGERVLVRATATLGDVPRQFLRLRVDRL